MASKVGILKSFFQKLVSGRSKQIIYCLVVILVAAIVSILLMVLRSKPEKQLPDFPAPLVKIQSLQITDIPMVIKGFGTVSAEVEVEIVPEVSGKVIWVNDQMKSGGFIKADQNMFSIDPRDYELALERAQAEVADALVVLDLEKAEAQVAIKEWQQLNPGRDPTSPLVLREPQIKRAQAKLASAGAGLAATKLDLERTHLSLPFDVRIVSEKVDVGQYVTFGQSLGAAYGIEKVEIEVPLEDSDLAWFDVPYPGRDVEQKPLAYVKANFVGEDRVWKGYVARTTGQVDERSRMTTVVIEISRPFDIIDNRPPLVPGIFVQVEIIGRVLTDAIAIPRDSIHNGNEVWIVNDDKLHIQTVDIVRSDEEYVYATKGLADDCKIIVSSLDMPIEAMRVRTENSEAAVDEKSENNSKAKE